MNTIKEMISEFETFNKNNIMAIEKDGNYLVYSYKTLIFDRRKKYFDNSYYSQTTSKLQNILIETFGLNNNVKKRG